MNQIVFYYVGIICTTFISAGACEMLRLTDGGIVPTDRNLIVFQRVDIGDKGIKTTYKAINHPQKPMVYFDENFDRWVIGRCGKKMLVTGMLLVFPHLACTLPTDKISSNLSQN